MAARSRPRRIRIACPQHNRLVRGRYEPPAGPAGGAEGGFLLEFVRCDQLGGRCAQTLCALHRFNRGVPGTWYPDRVMAAPTGRQGSRRSGDRSGSASPRGRTDVLA